MTTDLTATMNRRARAGKYDQPEAVDELRRRAEGGDLDAKAMLEARANAATVAEHTRRWKHD